MLRTSENRMIHIKAVGAVLLCSIAVACGQEGICNRTRQCSFPDIDQAIQRLSRALQHETISHTAATGASVFHSFITWLSTAYEVVWHRLRVEQVGEGGLSLLLTWPGSTVDLRPVLFISHTDVVPVENSTLEAWVHSPFSGAIADGCIWGRGALDVKGGLISLLEAATALLQEGYQPQRTLLFAFGHDEELGGAAGAGRIAALLASRYDRLEIIIDEGVGISLDGLAPFTAEPIALLATAEKQFQSVQVVLHSEGGHSSKPAIDGSTIGDRLARFLAGISRHPPPARLMKPTTDLLLAIIPLAPRALSVVLQAVLRFRPFRTPLAQLMARMSTEAALLVRSSAVVTHVSAGLAENVMPDTGTVKVNFRLMPGDTAENVLQITQQWLGRDAAHADVSLMDFATRGNIPPMSVADASGPHFALMAEAIQDGWRLQDTEQPIHVVPLLLPGMTDSRHFAALSPSGALRWSPWTFSKAGQELSRLHGVNERVSIADFTCGLVTYQLLLRKFGNYVGADLASKQEQGIQETGAHVEL